MVQIFRLRDQGEINNNNNNIKKNKSGEFLSCFSIGLVLLDVDDIRVCLYLNFIRIFWLLFLMFQLVMCSNFNGVSALYFLYMEVCMYCWIPWEFTWYSSLFMFFWFRVYLKPGFLALISLW